MHLIDEQIPSKNFVWFGKKSNAKVCISSSSSANRMNNSFKSMNISFKRFLLSPILGLSPWIEAGIDTCS
jgi:hypothetical protein